MLADNGRSTDRLLYGDDPATVIAVGGNTLSRGLTLEGLVSSYFLRSSTAYSTRCCRWVAGSDTGPAMAICRGSGPPKQLAERLRVLRRR